MKESANIAHYACSVKQSLFYSFEVLSFLSGTTIPLICFGVFLRTQPLKILLRCPPKITVSISIEQSSAECFLGYIKRTTWAVDSTFSSIDDAVRRYSFWQRIVSLRSIPYQHKEPYQVHVTESRYRLNETETLLH